MYISVKTTLIMTFLVIVGNSLAQQNEIRLKMIKPSAHSTISELKLMQEVELYDRYASYQPNENTIQPYLKISSPFTEMRDNVLQEFMGNRITDSAIINIDGMKNPNNSNVPDTDGDVGIDHYIQIVNFSFAIWDKQGNLLYGPMKNQTLWSNLSLNIQYDFDPIVLYDHLSNNWFISTVAKSNDGIFNYYLLIGVSISQNPLSGWNVWAYGMNELPDYPKYGLWPDGYYLTVNLFEAESYAWEGVGVGIFDREAMINGMDDPDLIFFTIEAANDNPHLDPYNILPAELDGNPPPEGTPNYLCYMKDDTWGFENDYLSIWACSADWETPENSTLTEISQLVTEPFDSNVDNFTYITQPETTRNLQSLGNKLMFSLKYRHFGNYSRMVTNHTVDVNNEDHAGIRWYELQQDEEDWYINQQGTYAPDSVNRWMGSIAMDEPGNIALVYSVSDKFTFPSIRYTGRLNDDPTGIMTVSEESIVKGGGYQSSTMSRWGDYSMMSIDPVDNFTFWYTQEYYKTSSLNGWSTRIASFRIASDTITGNSDHDDHDILLLKAFPNPFYTSTTLEYDLPSPGTVTIEIFNAVGMRVLIKQFRQAAYKNYFKWDATDFPSGMYSLILRTKDVTSSIRLIKLE
jgi:hypothetical protein